MTTKEKQPDTLNAPSPVIPVPADVPDDIESLQEAAKGTPSDADDDYSDK